MTELSRQRRAIEQKAALVEQDIARLSTAVTRTADRFKRDVSKPSTLLALFGAGLLFGALRHRGAADAASGDGGEPRHRRASAGAGKLTKVATVLLSAARLIELARKADRFRPTWSGGPAPDVRDGAGEPPPSRSPAFAKDEADQTKQDQAHGSNDSGEQQLAHRDGDADRRDQQ